MKINKIITDQSKYLQIISTIAKMPKSLYLIGDLPDERIPSVAIVGTRKPTPYGRDVTYKLAYELASRGAVIISGLALGTDSIAHQAALDAGGKTIAVLPGGLDRIYPSSHRELAISIIKNNGALLSEHPAGTTIYRGHFIARTRIIAGLADLVVIPESAAKGGTLHTANFALEQGKTVMAVPGNITSPQSEGCNNLIKTGAIPVTSTSDVLDELNLEVAQTALPLAANAEEQAILELLGQGVTDGDLLQKQSKLPPSTFSQCVTMLEIGGKIRALGGNQWGIR